MQVQCSPSCRESRQSGAAAHAESLKYPWRTLVAALGERSSAGGMPCQALTGKWGLRNVSALRRPTLTRYANSESLIGQISRKTVLRCKRIWLPPGAVTRAAEALLNSEDLEQPQHAESAHKPILSVQRDAAATHCACRLARKANPSRKANSGVEGNGKRCQ